MLDKVAEDPAFSKRNITGDPADAHNKCKENWIKRCHALLDVGANFERDHKDLY